MSGLTWVGISQKVAVTRFWYLKGELVRHMHRVRVKTETGTDPAGFGHKSTSNTFLKQSRTLLQVDLGNCVVPRDRLVRAVTFQGWLSVSCIDVGSKPDCCLSPRHGLGTSDSQQSSVA